MRHALSAFILLSTWEISTQQASAQDVNAANNPLTPKIPINFHDQWAPELNDVDEGSNALLFCGVIPHNCNPSRGSRVTGRTDSRATATAFVNTQPRARESA